jgi:peptidoglycan/xylan/chitin deacetylase (PgdA/CDA1 family)
MLVPQSINKDLTTPRIIITFDDGYTSVYTKAFPILQANNQKAVFFVCPNLNGSGLSTYSSLEQQQEMYAAGWDIVNHTWNHSHLTAITENEMHEAIDDAYKIIKTNFPRSSNLFVYPYGEYNQAVIDYLKKRDYVLARQTYHSGTHYHEQITLSDNAPFEIKAGGSVESATVISYIDDIVSNGGLFVFYYHKVVDEYNGEDLAVADLQTISDYLKTKQDAGLLKVVTMSEYYEDYLVGEKGAGTSMIRGLSHG